MATAEHLYAEQTIRQDRPQEFARKPIASVEAIDALLGAERVQAACARTVPRYRVVRIKGEVRTIPLRELLEAVVKQQTMRESAERTRRSLRWIALNRERYAGQWVALLGDRLLGTANTAKQLYAAIGPVDGIPLVVKVEGETEMPFSGW